MFADIKVFLGIISVVLGAVAFLPYLKDTLHGKTIPHVYTWFTWGTISLTAFALQISAGAGPGAWVTATAALMAFVVFALSLKNAEKQITKIDTIFFSSAFIALFLWLIAKQPIASSVVLVSVGLLGFFPTLRKSWNDPFSETMSLYSINAIRHLLSFFALTSYTFLSWFFPVAWGLMNGIFVLILLLRRHSLHTVIKDH